MIPVNPLRNGEGVTFMSKQHFTRTLLGQYWGGGNAYFSPANHWLKCFFIEHRYIRLGSLHRIIIWPHLANEVVENYLNLWNNWIAIVVFRKRGFLLLCVVCGEIRDKFKSVDRIVCAVLCQERSTDKPRWCTPSAQRESCIWNIFWRAVGC